MLDRRYLMLGLNALSRAHAMSFFEDGHRGGAIVAGWFLAREESLTPSAADALALAVDQRLAHAELCADPPPQNADPQLLVRLLWCLSSNLAGLRMAGHNVILPTLALRALAECPQAVTPARIDGLCKLAEAFTVTEVPTAPGTVLPDFDNPQSAAEFLLAEFLECTRRFLGHGQGWSGHLLTYGRALLDLRAMGYVDLARKAEEGFATYVGRIRLGPLERDIPRQEHEPTPLTVHEAEYWSRARGDWSLGHAVKYPYAFWGLMRLAGDEDLKRHCLAEAFRVL